MQTEGGPGEPPPTGAEGLVVDDRYELISQLGHGGMGVVWRARDRRLNRLVAVKELRLRGPMNPEMRAQWVARARREAEAVARIGHEHVVTVYDVIESSGQVWIVMEQVNPRSLSDLLQSHERLPAVDAARIALEVLRGLRAAHGEGVLHRDIKPHNVLFRRDGRAVLMDFGIATFEGAQQVTRVHETVGTPAYIAPELVEHHAPTQAGDLWSLGVTLYEMVEGRQPFTGPTPYDVLESVLNDQPRPMHFAGPLAPVISGLLEKDPALRLTAQRANELLQHVAQETPEPTPFRSGERHVLPGPAPVQPESPVPGPREPSPRPDGGGRGEAPDGPGAAGGEDGGSGSGGAGPVRRLLGSRGRAAGVIVLCLAVLAGLGWFTVRQLRQQADPLTQSETIRAAKSQHELVIGVKADQPGTGYQAPGTKKFSGFDIDLAMRIAQRLGFPRSEVRLVPVTSGSREPMIRTGRVDLIVASYSMTSSREKQVAFAGPYYSAGQDFLMRKNEVATYTGPSQFDGKTVCTVSGSSSLAYLKSNFRHSNISYRTYPTYSRCVDDLLHGSVAAVSTDDVILAGYALRHPNTLAMVGQPINVEDYGVGMPKGDPSLRTAVCGILRDYEQDGSWERSFKKNLARLISPAPSAPKPCPDLD